MRIVIAPDSFKGTAAAHVVAAAIADGWRQVRPDDELIEVPLADGGEGTIDAFERAIPGAIRQRFTVTDIDGFGSRTAEWLLLPDGTAVVEQAACGGLADLAALNPLGASSRGLGEAIRAAIEAGAARVLIGLGGSASNDGGAGLLQALGAGLLDEHGIPIEPGNAGLAHLVSIDAAGLIDLPPGGVQVAVDVRNPMLGPEGAIAVFGPQKGVRPDQVAAMDGRLAGLARLLGVDPEVPGTGAGGGAAAALLAWGAEIVPGSATIAEVAGLRSALAGADWVITGEGSVDGQTASGKVPALVESWAREANVPLLIAAGRIAVPTPQARHAVALLDLADGDVERAMRHTTELLTRAGGELARAVSTGD